jgi:hypothetical protein
MGIHQLFGGILSECRVYTVLNTQDTALFCRAYSRACQTLPPSACDSWSLITMSLLLRVCSCTGNGHTSVVCRLLPQTPADPFIRQTQCSNRAPDVMLSLSC